MLLVVFYHCIYCYAGWNGSRYCSDISVSLWSLSVAVLSHIHVPFFFIISGYLFAYRQPLLSIPLCNVCLCDGCVFYFRALCQELQVNENSVRLKITK